MLRLVLLLIGMEIDGAAGPLGWGVADVEDIVTYGRSINLEAARKKPRQHPDSP